LMPGLDQAARHRKTHFSEADESDFHGDFVLFQIVIACDKREAFAQGSKATKQSILSWRSAMDCFACARNDG